MLEKELLHKLKALGTSTLYEAAGRVGALPSAIRPIWKGAFVAGPAYTVVMPPGDNLALHHAVALAAPGDVLVADCQGYPESGVWGEILTVAAMQRGIVGLIVNGSVRDVDRLEALGFPVFACGVSMGGTAKEDGGRIGHGFTLGTATVRQGDVIVADSDGVLAIGATELTQVLSLAGNREDQERVMIESLRSGKTTIELLGLKPLAQ